MSQKIVNCALLSSFTLDQLPGRVDAQLASSELRAKWYVSPFNQYPQEILNSHSELYRSAPHVIFVAVALEDLCDDDGDGAGRVAELIGLIQTLTKRLPSTVIFVNSFLPTSPVPNPILTAKYQIAPSAVALQGNSGLLAAFGSHTNVHLVWLDQAFSGIALDSVTDCRFYYLAKMRYGRNAIDGLAHVYARRIVAHAGIRKKCIVVDLDNTLWGGVLGEEGMESIVLSDDGPGKAYQDMQKVLLAYYKAGTLLAICSKNDEELALKALREHPAMILRPQHFAATRINWTDKASNLHNLAADLNISTDSMVFLDDSQFECAEVQRLAPLVTVLNLPKDPSDYPSFVAKLPYFDALTATEDDRLRSEMYAVERRRKEFKHDAGSLQEFLKGLEIQVTVQRADRMGIPRLAQLSQKTNQFNLTTRRYSESDLIERLYSDGWRLYSLRASDRFGDSGVVGGCFIEVDPDSRAARVDSFFVSCRALGRGIEDAFLTSVVADLRRGGTQVISAEFIPSERNSVAKNFLSAQGFVYIQGHSWSINAEQTVNPPAWITVLNAAELSKREQIGKLT